MASKLELRFNSDGIVNETITIRTGQTYTFRKIRQGIRQVEVGKPDPSVFSKTGSNFKNAYELDDNFTGSSKVSYQLFVVPVPQGDPSQDYSIVTIENQDNTFFDGFINNTSFITETLSTTLQKIEPTFSIAISEADTAPCGNYKLTTTTDLVGGRIVVESPIGVQIADVATDGTPYVLNTTRPSAAVTGSVKLYETAQATVPLETILYNAPPVLSITSVEIEGSPFGALATINSTSGLVKTYSFDNIDYTGSNQRGGLLAGNFTAYVKDNLGCTKSKTFVVTEAQVQGLSVKEDIEVPLHNSLHFVDRTQNNFLGHISEEITADAPIKVFHDYLKTDTLRIQFKSSYASHTVRLYGCGSEEVLTVIQKSNNINRLNIYEGNYTEKQGRLAIYFTSGNIYEDDGVTPKATGHILNGLLLQWYKKGVYLKIEGVGVTKIERILYEGNTAYAITQLDPAGTVTNQPIYSIHSEHPYEVFEFDVNLNKAEGNYIVSIDYGAGEYISEIIRVHESLNEKYLKVQWYNDELNDQMVYSTGIKPFRRLKWDKYFTYVGQNERETYDTDTTIKLVNSKSKAIYELEFRPQAMEMAHGFIDGLNHASNINIDGAVFICNSAAKPENRGNWYFVKCELALIGQTIESIETDLTQINSEFIKTTGYLKVSNTGFLKV